MSIMIWAWVIDLQPEEVFAASFFRMKKPVFPLAVCVTFVMYSVLEQIVDI
jgi:hypothetical protein